MPCSALRRLQVEPLSPEEEVMRSVKHATSQKRKKLEYLVQKGLLLECNQF